MQQILIACGSNQLGQIVALVGVLVLFFINLGIKWFFLAKTRRSARRSLFIDSFGLMFMTGVVTVFVFISAYILPTFLFVIEIGFFYSYQIFIWAIVCIVDTFLIERWLLKPKAQAISLNDDQQLQVEAVPMSYQPAWAVALQSNTLIVILVALFFQMIDSMN